MLFSFDVFATRKSRILLFAAVVVFSAALSIIYLTVPTSPDQALFDYIAWQSTQGIAYYSGSAEQNWPGKILIHELGIRLFGVHFWTFRLIDAAILILTCLGISILLRRADFVHAPWILPPLYMSLYISSGYWMAGQRDIVATGIMITACLGLVSRSEWNRRAMAGLFCAGSMIALAVLIRPTYLLFLLTLFAVELYFTLAGRQKLGVALKRCFIVGSGFLSLLIAVVVAGLLTGNLADWYEQTILYNLQAYPTQASRLQLLPQLLDMVLQSWHWLSILSFFGFLFWIHNNGVTRLNLLLIGVLATITTSYFAMNKGFGYHLGGFIPVFSIFTAIFVDLLVRKVNQDTGRVARTFYALTACAVSVLIVAGVSKKLYALAPNVQSLTAGSFSPLQSGSSTSYDEIDLVVRKIRDQSDPDSYILQWGRNFQIGYLAERRSSIRFVSTPALEILSEHFSGHDAWIEQIRRDLAAKPPLFIAVDKASYKDGSLVVQSAPDQPEAVTIVSELIESDYRLEFETKNILLFRRKI